MKKLILRTAAIIVTVSSMMACSDMSNMPHFGMSGSSQTEKAKNTGMMARTIDQSGKATPVAVTMTGGEEIGLKSMNATDRNKMSRALDSATGKSTHWKNEATGMEFTVTPVKKIVINDNPFCREYTVLVVRGDRQKQVHGRACVTTDGSWHTI